MKVFVYYNLHRKCWSVKALEGSRKGRVVDHCDSLCLAECTFKVSEAGRQRVLREKKKNVHAGVVGYIMTNDSLATSAELFALPVRYNPYKYSTFVDKDDNSISQAEVVIMKHGKVLAVGAK